MVSSVEMFKLLRKNSEKNIEEKDKKNLLGLKVTQAQQNPEPIYDLSNCSAGSLPDDTYTFCKLLGKTTLCINDNALSNLQSGGSMKDLAAITVLDASSNKIEKLPSDFDCLQNLTALNISQNLLKSLPEGFRSLACLKKLNLANNKFKQFPSCLCSLEALETLNVSHNSINSLPKDFHQLQSTLIFFEADFQKFVFPKPEKCISLQSIMEYLCESSNTLYTPGLNCNAQNASSLSSEVPDNSIVDGKINVKKYKKLAHPYLDPELEEAQREQMEAVLRSTSQNREQLLADLSAENNETASYETQKHEKRKDHLRLEQELKLGQEKELTAYLDTAHNKESILETISSDETSFQKEVGDIVAAKDREREWFINQLTNAEQNIELALNEIVQGSQMCKSDDLMILIEEQEVEMSKLLNELVETSTELHRKDVMNEMQKTFSQALVLQYRSQAIEKKQSTIMDTLDSTIKTELDHIEELIKSKSSNQLELVANLLNDEKHQAEAFKLLLMKSDVKRNEVVRQITLVEHELMRLSSVELVKKKCGVVDSTSITEKQRETLVELLCSLLKDKENRDDELQTWFLELTKKRDETMSREDFWLCQYQHLMSIKPPALDKAEQMVDDEVKEILYMALATDLLPLFARNGISFTSLMNMSPQDFEAIGVGVATYQSIQRSLQSYLFQKKSASGGGQADSSELPSAPEEYQVVEPLDMPSAPCDDPYLETECVICLNNEPCVIFMNCGHVCTCDTCCVSLSICPLCRAHILSKCLFNSI